jgi:hypothetical protein
VFYHLHRADNGRTHSGSHLNYQHLSIIDIRDWSDSRYCQSKIRWHVFGRSLSAGSSWRTWTAACQLLVLGGVSNCIPRHLQQHQWLVPQCTPILICSSMKLWQVPMTLLDSWMPHKLACTHDTNFFKKIKIIYVHLCELHWAVQSFINMTKWIHVSSHIGP